MMTQTPTKTDCCEKCSYWNAKSDTNGDCRRQPPQAISFLVDNETRFETRFPTTAAGDWCGEFKAE